MVRAGCIIMAGVDKQLHEYRDLEVNSQTWLKNYLSSCRSVMSLYTRETPTSYRSSRVLSALLSNGGFQHVCGHILGWCRLYYAFVFSMYLYST